MKILTGEVDLDDTDDDASMLPDCGGNRADFEHLVLEFGQYLEREQSSRQYQKHVL